MSILLSYPRQGTDWFMKCIMPLNRYHREYFNFITNKKHTKILKEVFGNENNIEKIFYECTEDEFLNAYNKTWKLDNVRSTKENFCHIKCKHIYKYFKNVYILYRHRKYTFPTTRERYIVGMYESFLQNKYSVHKFNKIRDFCKEKKFENTLILSHIISFCILMYYAQLFDIPIINWYDLVTFTEDQLKELYEKSKLENFTVDYKKWINNVMKTRITVKEVDKRRCDYEKHVEMNNAEIECKELIDFIKSLDMLDEKYMSYII